MQRMGNAYVKLDDLEKAISAYEKSLTEHRTPDTLQKLRDTQKLQKEKAKAAYYNPELADKAREEGNKLFKEQNWWVTKRCLLFSVNGNNRGKTNRPAAIERYTEAINRNEKDARPYSNRAACYLKLMAVYEAEKDANKCIELDPTFGTYQ